MPKASLLLEVPLLIKTKPVIMCGVNKSRSKRWNRRSSDGAAWQSDADDVAASDEDEGQQPRRPSSCGTKLRHIVASEPLLSREPIRITGEFRERVAAASRASLVTFVTLSILVFSGQEYLPVPWIGNVLAVAILRSTLGDTIIASKDIFVPMLPIAMGSWGISVLLELLSTEVYSIVLPFVVMFGSLMIFLCPWPYLTMKNLMLVVFYLMVASPLSLRHSGYDVAFEQEELGVWFVPGLVGTCIVGLMVALGVHVALIPSPISTAASRMAPRLVKQLSHESHQLLSSASEYTRHIGKATTLARQARTLIEFYVNSRGKTLEKLSNCLPAMRTERRFLTRPNNLDAIENFVECAKKQQVHAELIRKATTQQFLGEELTSQNETVRAVKSRMSTNLGFAVEQLVIEYERSEAALFFGSSDSDDASESKLVDLHLCLERYRKAMRQAIIDAESLLIYDDAASRSTTGPLIRQRVAFLAVFSFIHELRATPGLDGKQDTKSVATKSVLKSVQETLLMPWLWEDLAKRRLAMKAAVGMGLASLWVSIPYLRGYVAYPNSIWVGVTVASVSLEQTGAAYQRSIDRLFGTLIAAGYALLIGKLFDHSNSVAKLIALSAFTFGAIFLRNPNRPYSSRYAATSVGSILYGSFDSGMEVDEYVPNRIMLMFIGVVTFLFVEVLVFPRSSRTVVQASTLQFFEDLEHFLFDSSKVCGSISSIRCSTDPDHNAGQLSDDDPLWMLREGHAEVTLTEDLIEAAGNVKKTVALAKSELGPGIAEPSLGLNVSLDVKGYENLLAEQGKILSQTDVLIRTLKSLIGYYRVLEDGHHVKSLHWPALLSASLVKMAQRLSECADKLRNVFPNGVCRPGPCQTSHVIRAVAAFRNFDDAILDILSDVADRHSTYFSTVVGTLGSEVRYGAAGFRLTLALAVSAILTIGQSLSDCGKHLETIVQSFPVEEVKCQSNDDFQQARAVSMGYVET